jgi:hypothetical protein
VSQPGWPVPSWTVELAIPASGTTGSWNSPSQGCSGTLVLAATATSVMPAVAETTDRPTGSGCTIRARLTLVLSGSELSLTWTPVEHPLVPGSATLTGG